MTTRPADIPGDADAPRTPPFPDAARRALADSQLRHNLAHATQTIRAKRAEVVDELPDWEDLRDAGAAIKDRTLARLDTLLLQLEERVTTRGGTVHWARDRDEANRIVADIVRATGETDVVKAKSMLSEEIKLNEHLEAAGIHAHETDLAQLVVQLAGDAPSHILVPAIHKNRQEIRALFADTLDDAGQDLSDDPRQLTEAARRHLRRRFLTTKVGISGANFAVAETGTIALVESEGNGRMALTLPDVLITLCGVEKLIPTWDDLEVFLQLLPRSSTAERMNPYTSLWSGVTPGDGPQAFHLVLVDNGRTGVLADEVGRQTLRCIRCSACLNVCPVYERTGGHAYGSTYPGPIGAILTPLMAGLRAGTSLPFASSLCGACADVCPVKIDIPEVLVALRGRVSKPRSERAAMRALARVFGDRRLYEAAQRGGRLLPRSGPATRVGPLGAWTESRELPPATRSFRDWWRDEHGA